MNAITLQHDLYADLFADLYADLYFIYMLIIFYYIVIKGMVLNEGLSYLDHLFQNFQMWHGNFLKKTVVKTLNDVCFLFGIPYIMDKRHG